MTEKWRPPNWKNPYSDDKVRIHNLSTLIDEMQTGLHLDHQYRKDMERVFEAGADAMLEALQKSAVRHPLVASGHIGTVWYDPLTGAYPSCNGVWVFIPDDDKEEGK